MSTKQVRKSISQLVSMIPNEVWVDHIFVCVPTKELLTSACVVCKSWSKMISNSNCRLCRILFEKIFLSKFKLRKKKCNISWIPLIELQKLLVKNDIVRSFNMKENGGGFGGFVGGGGGGEEEEEEEEERMEYLFLKHRPSLTEWDKVDDCDIFQRNIDCEVYIVIQKKEVTVLKKMVIEGWTHMTDEWYNNLNSARLGEQVYIYNGKENSTIQGKVWIKSSNDPSESEGRGFSLNENGGLKEFSRDNDGLAPTAFQLFGVGNNDQQNEQKKVMNTLGKELLGIPESCSIFENSYSFVRMFDEFVQMIESIGGIKDEFVSVKWRENSVRLVPRKKYEEIDLKSDEGLKELEKLL